MQIGGIHLLRVVLSAALLVQAAFAGPLLTNIGAAQNGNDSISGGTLVAVGFNVLPGNNYNLTGAMFSLFNGVNGPNGTPLAGSTLSVGLFADNGGQPAASPLVNLALASGTTIVAGGGTYTATPVSPFVLVGGTSYWLMLNDPTANSLNWEATNTSPAPPTPPPPAGASYNTTLLGPPFSSTAPVLVEIDATVVQPGGAPEPDTLALIVTGLLALHFRRVRKS